MAKKVKISIIIPCYNEAQRLPQRFREAYSFLNKRLNNFEIIFVDDGSTDNTKKILEDFAQKFQIIKVISYPKNSGKGFALVQGVKVAESEIIAFTDADFSISLDSLDEFINLISEGKADIVIGSRRELSSKALSKQNKVRRALGKALSFINRFFLNLDGIADTQCGFKVFKAEVAKKLFSKLTVYRWLFDIEILMLAKEENLRIEKRAVEWEDIKGSKVNILNDLIPVSLDLLKIYLKFLTLRSYLALITVATAVILFPFFINPTSLVLRNGDYSDIVRPDYFFIKQSIINYHQIPLWNPTLLSGIPEIANPQSPLIYPINVITLILPIELGIVTLIFLHILIGGLFSYLLARNVLKFSGIATLVLSFGFIFSPFLWSKFAVGHLSQGFAITLVSPILYFGIKSYQKFKIITFLGLIFFLAMQYLNYPTIWYYSCFFSGLIGFIFSLTQKKLKNFLIIILAAPLSLFLIFPIILVQLQAGPLITRSALSLKELSLPVWSIKRFILSVVTPSNLRSDLETEVWLYPGLGLMVAALFGGLKTRFRISLTLLASLLLVMLITLGNRTLLFSTLATFIPGFSYLRVSTRVWFVAIVLLSLLAAFGIEKIKYKLKIILGLIIVFDLYLFSVFRIWFVPQIMQTQQFNSLENLLISNPSSNYRTYCTKRCLSARYTLPLNINTADGYHLLLLKDYQNAIASAGGFTPTGYTGNIPAYEVADAQPSAEKLGKMAVKWLISDHLISDHNFKFIKQANEYSLYQNKLALPRIRINSNNIIKVIKDSPNILVVITDGQAGELFIADNYYPGWKSYIDGKEVNISKVDGWARMIFVPSGKHVIEQKFNPFLVIKLW